MVFLFDLSLISGFLKLSQAFSLISGNKVHNVKTYIVDMKVNEDLAIGSILCLKSTEFVFTLTQNFMDERIS